MNIPYISQAGPCSRALFTPPLGRLGALSLSKRLLAASAAVLCALTVTPARADTFGFGANTFTIPFVLIGNPGNAADTTGYGAVSYNYNMSTYAVSQADINAAVANGFTNSMTGSWTGNQAATTITWFQAAAFVNWLNTSQGYAPAYNLTYSAGSYSMALWSPAQAWQLGGQDLYRSANCEYFLPSENEYYKAAYYDPNANSGAGGYWLYATGSSTAPTAVASGTAAYTAVYDQSAGQGPAAVDQSGGLSPYGTMGQTGNVYEWTETSYAGDNTDPSEVRALRGGFWDTSAANLQSSSRLNFTPGLPNDFIGFRVASVPEPSSMVLMIGPCLMFLARRRARSPLGKPLDSLGALSLSKRLGA